MPSDPIAEATVLEALREVFDPELGENVVDLGLIYDVNVDRGQVRITMTLTTPGCPLHESLTSAVEQAIFFTVPGVQAVQVDLVFDPPWEPARMTPEARDRLGVEA